MWQEFYDGEFNPKSQELSWIWDDTGIFESRVQNLGIRIFFKFFFSFIGGRCLAQEHCAGLRNSICQEDSNVKLPNGLPIQTCQCMDGYIDQRFGCEKDDEGFEPGTSMSNFNRKFLNTLSSNF